MRLFTLILTSLAWAGVAALVDKLTRNFGLSLGLGAVAALCVVLTLSLCNAAALADRKRDV